MGCLISSVVGFFVGLVLFIIPIGIFAGVLPPSQNNGGTLQLWLIGIVLLIICGPTFAIQRNKLRQPKSGNGKATSPVVSALVLSTLNENNTIVRIPLPQNDALIFVSEPSNNFFKVIIPKAVESHVDRLIKPWLEQYSQVGWELDTSEPVPREILYEGAGGCMMSVPFTKVRFRCTDVLLHLRRRKTK